MVNLFDSMNFSIILTISCIVILGIFGTNVVAAEIDTLNDIEFLILENLIQQTLTVTINTENENSKSSKILQIFSLGKDSDDGKSYS